MKKENSRQKSVLIIIGVALACILVLNEVFGSPIIRRIVNPILGKTSQATENVTDFVDEKYIHDEKQLRINQLEEENAKLRQALIESTIGEKELQELNDLKKMLNHKEELIYDTHISADLIAKDGNDFYTSFLISAGSNDGLKKGDLALSGNGLAGVVRDVQPDYSRVLSILDAQISISFKAVRSESISGVASQNIDSEAFNNIPDGMLRGYVFDNADVLVGDIIITSGMGIYPQGIEIGEVYQVVEDNTSLLKYVYIKPYTNFNDLSKLLVINTRTLD